MKRLVLVDLSNFIFKSYFAIRPLTTPKGVPVNAVYGVALSLIKIIEKYNPDKIVVANDLPKKSFRKEKYSEYKANRKKPDNDLSVQFPLVNKLVDLFNLERIGMEGYEADDIIASVAKQYEKSYDEILIASNDKDLMQLVGDKIKILDLSKDLILGEAEVKAKMGVKPSQVKDLLSIIGDSSDNVPGVKGIGIKGAAKLITEHGSVENLYQNLESIKSDRTRNLLTEYKDSVVLAGFLITLEDSLTVELDLDKKVFNKIEDLNQFLDDLAFKSIKEKVNKLA